MNTKPFVLYGRPTALTSHASPELLFSTVLSAFPNDPFARFRDQSRLKDGSIDKAVRFEFHYSMTWPGQDLRELVSFGNYSVDASGLFRFSLGARPWEAGHPGNDLGAFFKTIILPIAKALGAKLGTIGEETQADKVPEAYDANRLPYRSEGYLLAPNFVSAIGLGRLREAVRASTESYVEWLEKCGLPPDPSPEQIEKVEDAIVGPRPFLFEDASGIVLVYGLSLNEKEWRALGVAPRQRAKAKTSFLLRRAR